MSKKPVKKTTPTKTKKKAAPAPTPAAPKATGMWKILEMKKAQQKLNEQSRSEGRNAHGQGQSFQSHPRDPKFTKFAGPRRKVG